MTTYTQRLGPSGSNRAGRVVASLHWVLAALCLLTLWLGRPAPAAATPQFSAQTSLSCMACHENPEGGGTLTQRGQDFRNAGFSLPPAGRPSPWRSGAWLGLGFLHVLAGVLWFGAIFYVHLFIRARSLTGGLPKGERVLGLVSIIIVGLTGIGLTWLRLHSLDELWTTTFGIVLLVKVAAFMVMLGIAITTTTYINRKLKQASSQPAETSSATDTLISADGLEGRPAHVAINGQIYDVSASRLWKNGKHMGRHQAGQDLSEALTAAPHGPEVLERVLHLGPAPTATAPSGQEAPPPPVARLFLVLTYTVLVCIFIILLCVAWWNWGPPLVHAASAWRSDLAISCLGCHAAVTPAVHADWLKSFHARSRVSCVHCHQANPDDPARSLTHDKVYAQGGSPWAADKYRLPVKALVSPADCARCHPRQAKEYARSKHANTIEIMWKIDPWLNAGQNADIERQAGCFQCHGTVVATKNGKLDPATWPNVGVGRLNLDGSKGSCSSCHTRHKFSVAEARQPDTCGQCHLGPDHPQMEIWNESKHGAIYRSEGAKWNMNAVPGTWTAGLDYRTPTCAACHMSGTGAVMTTHDLTERLAWELQAPLTIRPAEFKPFPAATDWKTERQKMTQVCLACHSPNWVTDHFTKLDAVVVNYNDNYFKPVKAKLDELINKGLLVPKGFFKQPLFTEYYELWHHEGRRARMGTAMMAPDYAWWHGFYECKKRYVGFMKEADHLLKTGGKAYMAPALPGATGNTTRPVQVFGNESASEW